MDKKEKLDKIENIDYTKTSKLYKFEFIDETRLDREIILIFPQIHNVINIYTIIFFKILYEIY